MPRYLAIEDSQTSHCCFVATVVDTEQIETIGDGVVQFYEVCECLDRDSAVMIATALNKMQEGGE